MTLASADLTPGRNEFAPGLHRAIVEALVDFRRQVPGELPYAFALILGQAGNYLGHAIATEEGLLRVATLYESTGYRYQGEPAAGISNLDQLMALLRWSNPDDGWRYGDFPVESGIPSDLARLVSAGAFGPQADGLERFCCGVLAALQADPEWSTASSGLSRPPIVGVTSGDDPDDFFRTACQANDPDAVRQLQAEYSRSEELTPMIHRLR